MQLKAIQEQFQPALHLLGLAVLVKVTKIHPRTNKATNSSDLSDSGEPPQHPPSRAISDWEILSNPGWQATGCRKFELLYLDGLLLGRHVAELFIPACF